MVLRAVVYSLTTRIVETLIPVAHVRRLRGVGASVGFVVGVQKRFTRS